MDNPATARLCDECDHVGPLERERCELCYGSTWPIFEAQRAIGEAMQHVRRFGFTLERCPCCKMFRPKPPGEGAVQCDCGAMYRPHPSAQAEA